jgi:hypothetical protein
MYYEERLINGVMHCRWSHTGEFEPMTIIQISEAYQKLKDDHYKKINENIYLRERGLFDLNVVKVDTIPDDMIIMVAPDGSKVIMTGIGK